MWRGIIFFLRCVQICAFADSSDILQEKLLPLYSVDCLKQVLILFSFKYGTFELTQLSAGVSFSLSRFHL